MEDLPEYSDLLGRGGETIAMAAAKYLYSMANFGEPRTTGVRDACSVLEKLDFSKEHHIVDSTERRQRKEAIRMLILKRLAVWFLETSSEVLLLGVALIALFGI